MRFFTGRATLGGLLVDHVTLQFAVRRIELGEVFVDQSLVGFDLARLLQSRLRSGLFLDEGRRQGDQLLRDVFVVGSPPTRLPKGRVGLLLDLGHVHQIGLLLDVAFGLALLGHLVVEGRKRLRVAVGPVEVVVQSRVAVTHFLAVLQQTPFDFLGGLPAPLLGLEGVPRGGFATQSEVDQFQVAPFQAFDFGPLDLAEGLLLAQSEGLRVGLVVELAGHELGPVGLLLVERFEENLRIPRGKVLLGLVFEKAVGLGRPVAEPALQPGFALRAALLFITILSSVFIVKKCLSFFVMGRNVRGDRVNGELDVVGLVRGDRLVGAQVRRRHIVRLVAHVARLPRLPEVVLLRGALPLERRVLAKPALVHVRPLAARQEVRLRVVLRRRRDREAPVRAERVHVEEVVGLALVRVHAGVQRQRLGALLLVQVHPVREVEFLQI